MSKQVMVAPGALPRAQVLDSKTAMNKINNCTRFGPLKQISGREKHMAGRLYQLEQHPSSWVRGMAIKGSPRLPGRLGDGFEGRVAFVANLGDMYAKGLGFLQKNGYLYATGNPQDLERFYVERNLAFQHYRSEMKPYISGRVKRVLRPIASSLSRLVSEIFAPGMLLFLTSVLEPLVPDFGHMDRREFKRKSDLFTSFFFEDPLTSLPADAEKRVDKIAQVAEASYKLASSFYQQHSYLATIVSQEAINSMFLSSAQVRHYYRVKGGKDAPDGVSKLIEALPANISVAKSEQQDVTWDTEGKLLQNRNFSVRLRSEKLEGEERHTLCLRYRFPKGSPVMLLRKFRPSGWLGTHSKTYTAEVDIRLPLKGEKINPQDFEHIRTMLHFMGIGNVTPERLCYGKEEMEKFFADHGFKPSTSYRRSRTEYTINGTYRVVVDSANYVRKGENEWNSFPTTVRLQRGWSERQPKFFRKIWKMDGLGKSRSGPFELSRDKDLAGKL